MAMYRINITLPDGRKDSYTALFVDGFEAIEQTLADFPEARCVAAIFIRKAAA
jgi:hypothetical protein